MIAFSHAVLAGAALLVSAACLLAAPLLAALAELARRLVAGGAPVVPWRVYGRLAEAFAAQGVEAPGEGRLVDGAVACAAAATGAAALLVPGFATGTALSRLADLPLVAALLVLARLASLAAELAPGRSTVAVTAASLPFAAALLLPALLPVAAAMAALGASRLDALPAALAGADPATRILLACALALTAFADLEGGRRLGAALSGPTLALAEIAEALRLLVWCDLLGPFVPPFFVADAQGGPLAWAASLLLWALRCGVLACLLGAVRAATARLAAAAMIATLGSAMLLALLAAVLVFIGQSFA